MVEEKRELSQQEMEAMRRSVEQGVNRVVKPFLKRVKAQSKVSEATKLQ